MNDDRTDELLKAIDDLKHSMSKEHEGLRQQNSAEHDHQHYSLELLKTFASWWRSVWHRVGRNTWPGDHK